MAKNTADVAAAKAKKQKTMLIVGGVLLLAVAAIQVPKLMKKDSQPESESTAALASTGATAAAATPSGAVVVTGSVNAGAKPAGFVAGVALPRGTVVLRAAPSQLATFTLFEVKDPFVQQAGVETADGASTTTDAQASTGTTDASTTATGGTAEPTQGSSEATAPPPVVYATINLDGKPQQVKVKQKFPTGEPLFVLRSLSKKQAKIGVAGGSFDDGGTVTLQFGKKVTLVNTATGVRYELKLVYTGADPETIAGFTPAPQGSAAASASTGSSTSTTTAAPS